MKSVAVDSQGDVVAAGYTFNTGTQLDWTVAKFDGNGTLLWQQTLHGTVNGFDEAYSVAVDNQGNVAVAGYTNNGRSYYDFTVAMLDRDGTLLWQRSLNGKANYFDTAVSVAVDNHGNMVAAGSVANRFSGPPGYTVVPDFTVVKFAGDGTLLWQQNLTSTRNSLSRALSVAVDHEGNVVAAGVSDGLTLVKVRPVRERPAGAPNVPV